MLTVTDREAIRRAYYREQKSIRTIARELHHSRDTVKQALTDAAPAQYTLSQPRAAPVLGPYKERLQELLAENAQLPRKQRYTGDKILELLCAKGYTGAASTVRGYLSQLRRTHRQRRSVYLPLAFAPGEAAQVDWGEAAVILAGVQQTVQVFVMWLCYSRRLFVMAFPTQRPGVDGPLAGRDAMELRHQLSPFLKQLRLSGILETLEARNQQAVDGQWSYIEFLSRLLEDEVARRAQKQLTRRIRRATINTTKTLEGFDFSFNPALNRQRILDLATCTYIRQHRNILLCGPTGTGKTQPG